MHESDRSCLRYVFKIQTLSLMILGDSTVTLPDV